MNKLKKAVVLLLVFSMLSLIMGNTAVFANPDQTPESGFDSGSGQDTGTVDTGDTGTGDTGDTGTGDTGDTGDTGTGDTGDIGTGDTGDTGTGDIGDIGTGDTGLDSGLMLQPEAEFMLMTASSYYTLDVSFDSGKGSVAVSGDNGKTGSKYKFNYIGNNYGTASLTATAQEGYRFTGWSGASSSTNASISIFMDGNKNITANFEWVGYRLTLESDPAGVTIRTEPNPNANGYYDRNTQVILSPGSVEGWQFDHWQSDSEYTAPNGASKVKMDADKKVKAVFKRNNYTVSASTNLGYGTVTKAPNLSQYAYEASVTLTAPDIPGYQLDNWTVNGSTQSSTGPNKLAITVTQNMTVVANYSVIAYELTAATNPAGIGAISVTPFGSSFPYNTSVTLAAPAIAGYDFHHWSGDVSGNIYVNTTSVLMTQNKSVVANYTAHRHSLTIVKNPPEGGTVAADKNPGMDDKYDYNTEITLTAQPASGYAFAGWSGAASGEGLSTTVTIPDNDITVTASFKKLFSLTLDSNPGDGGQVRIVSSTKPAVDGRYIDGTEVVIEAVPAENYRFTGWSDGASGDTNPLTVCMTDNKTITANFVRGVTLTLDVNKDADNNPLGTTSPSVGSYAKDEGESVTITATPAEGYHFKEWQGDIGLSNVLNINNSTITVSMTENRSITAVFEINKYSLTIISDPLVGGLVGASPLPGWGLKYDHGTVVNLTAHPNPIGDFVFTGWTGAVTGTELSTSVTMTGNKVIVAHFSLTIPLNVSVTPEGSGTVEIDKAADKGSNRYIKDTILTLAPNAAHGWKFDHWHNGFGFTVPDGNNKIKMDWPRAVKAVFVKDTFTLTVEQSEGGHVTQDGSGTYEFGSVANLSVTTTNSSWRFVGWVNDAPYTDPGSDNALQMNDNYTVKPIFARNDQAYLDVEVSGGGSVSGEGLYTIDEIAELQVTANYGWHFAGWDESESYTVPDSGEGDGYTVKMDYDKAVKAIFERNEYTLTVEQSEGGTVSAEGSNPYLFEDSVQLSYEAKPGWYFAGWVDSEGYDVPEDDSITMDSNKTVKAIFVREMYSLTLTTSGTGSGQISITVISGSAAEENSYPSGTKLELTANAGANSSFGGWSGDAEGNTIIIEIIMNGNKAINAAFSMV